MGSFQVRINSATQVIPECITVVFHISKMGVFNSDMKLSKKKKSLNHVPYGLGKKVGSYAILKISTQCNFNSSQKVLYYFPDTLFIC